MHCIAQLSFIAVGGLLAACAEPGAGAPPGSTSQFDGTYEGIMNVAPRACGPSGDPIRIEIGNSVATVRLPSGSTVTGRVAPDGSISALRYSNPNRPFFGSQSGSGTVSNNRVNILFNFHQANFSNPCTYRYEAQRIA